MPSAGSNSNTELNHLSLRWRVTKNMSGRGILGIETMYRFNNRSISINLEKCMVVWHIHSSHLCSGIYSYASFEHQAAIHNNEGNRDWSIFLFSHLTIVIQQLSVNCSQSEFSKPQSLQSSEVCSTQGRAVVVVDFGEGCKIHPTTIGPSWMLSSFGVTYKGTHRTLVVLDGTHDLCHPSSSSDLSIWILLLVRDL